MIILLQDHFVLVLHCCIAAFLISIRVPVAPSVGVSPNQRPKRAACLGFRVGWVGQFEVPQGFHAFWFLVISCNLLSPVFQAFANYNRCLDNQNIRMTWHAYLEYCVRSKCVRSKRASLCRVAPFQDASVSFWLEARLQHPRLHIPNSNIFIYSRCHHCVRLLSWQGSTRQI